MRISRCTASNPAQARGRALLGLVLLLVLAGLAAWWYFAPRALPGFVQRWLPESPKANPPLYAWHDAQGHLQVTDKPPTDRPYKILHFDPKANVLPKGVAPSK